MMFRHNTPTSCELLCGSSNVSHQGGALFYSTLQPDFFELYFFVSTFLSAMHQHRRRTRAEHRRSTLLGVLARPGDQVPPRRNPRRPLARRAQPRRRGRGQTRNVSKRAADMLVGEAFTNAILSIHTRPGKRGQPQDIAGVETVCGKNKAQEFFRLFFNAQRRLYTNKNETTTSTFVACVYVCVFVCVRLVFSLAPVQGTKQALPEHHARARAGRPEGN